MNTAGNPGNIEYRIEHLRDRLAREELAELGVRIEPHGSGAMVRGCVNDAAARTAVLMVVAEELAGIDWHADLTVSWPRPPDRAEELA
ncbi:hypothetical protein [Streptomyces sp. WAC06614]|uniref:hypothetical protein n=1 Tax=Streptomyces sp. WAC06614 TaxID=2487416 RepID=UPI000F797409|nr:hypothetical protein [Streptomyces sp. WAC06614]RSS65366.1 hypothetical protein EF918_30015 [Streptomyces sp. WAC06614]